MALIACPECGKEISDKAKACPNCGCPISDLQTDEEVEKVEPFPNLPLIMKVGKQIVNWGLDAALNGSYFHSENVIKSIPEGDVSLMLHTNGICISKGTNFHYISDEQITNMSFATKETIIEQNKSVIGRAAVGGLILGPLGAIIGGISGVGSKSVLKGKYYLVINFWDVYTRKLQTILICTQSMPTAFINRFNKEKQQKNVPDGDECVVNVFKDDQSLNEDNVVQIVKLISPLQLSSKIQWLSGLDGSMESLAYVANQVNTAISNKGVSKEEIKQSSGCMVMLLVMLSTTIAGIIAACSRL